MTGVQLWVVVAAPPYHPAGRECTPGQSTVALSHRSPRLSNAVQTLNYIYTEYTHLSPSDGAFTHSQISHIPVQVMGRTELLQSPAALDLLDLFSHLRSLSLTSPLEPTSGPGANATMGLAAAVPLALR